MRNIKNRRYLSWLFVFALVFSLVCGGTSAEVMAKGSKKNTIKSVSLRIVEHCNLSGQTVIPFCTSASSGIGTSATNLQEADTSQAMWLTGRRYSGSSPKSDVESWISGLGLQ